MANANVKVAQCVDATFQLRWELSKEKFDNCQFPKFIISPKYVVQIGSEKSEWTILMYPSGYPKGDDDRDKNNVVIGLISRSESKQFEVLTGFAVKTNNGYWPENFAEHLHQRYDKQFLKIGGETGKKSRLYIISTKEEFIEHFVDNKMTLVAHLVLSMGEENSPSAMETANDFIDNFKEISALDDLSDFTIICQDKRFSCHKVMLAASSEYFELLFKNEKNRTELEIDDAKPEIVEAILNFMSKSQIPNNIDDIAMDLIKLADMFRLNLLKRACETGLVKNLSVENALETFDIVDKHVTKVEIRQKILSFIKKESLEIVKTRHWREFVQNYPDLVTEMFVSLASK